jgi:hypothetical protein
VGGVGEERRSLPPTSTDVRVVVERLSLKDIVDTSFIEEAIRAVKE